MKRRIFLKQSTALGMSSIMLGDISFLSANNPGNQSTNGKPLTISSANGLRATQKAMEIIQNGSDAIAAVISGVNIIENDPEDVSVGYGGLPNEQGVVELDACCMHGPTHNAGAVASIRNIKNPSKVAQLVMERTDHELLVGQGALNFAKAHGFVEENLLTDKARKIWLHWKETLNDRDDWFPADSKDIPKDIKKYFGITGTITCLGLDKKGGISGVTTTSGLAFKIPGRVGDSPIIGAGLYVDNEIGACGSTGRGEENLKNLSCFLAVEFMRQGQSPQQACLNTVKRIVNHAKLPSLLGKNGKPNFNVSFYALNKNGDFGAASVYGPVKYAVNNGVENKLFEGSYLFGRKDKK